MAKAKSVTLKFTKERETKNKVRYEEVGSDPVIDKLYVSKAKLDELGNPENLTVTLEEA